ncbi:MAG: hypothetical protein M1396_05300 [Chloroflexi bacterium]|nr:hypothetical protein [Chloroflexota bacterium]
MTCLALTVTPEDLAVEVAVALTAEEATVLDLGTAAALELAAAVLVLEVAERPPQAESATVARAS